jgi:hypothetical protein
MKKTLKINLELTDTFGGEANYSWVRRGSFTVPENASDLSIIRKAKKLMDMNGVACRKESFGDMWAFYPIGSCVVLFVSFDTGF